MFKFISLKHSLMYNERNNPDVWGTLYEKDANVAAEFDIIPSRPRRAGRQIHHANRDVDTVSDYWRITLFNVFLDHLIQEMETHHSIFCSTDCLVYKIKCFHPYMPHMLQTSSIHLKLSVTKLRGGEFDGISRRIERLSSKIRSDRRTKICTCVFISFSEYC